MPRILVAGCGYVGSRLAERLVSGGHRVWGLRRSPATLPDGVVPLAADVSDRASLEAVPTELDALVYAVSPGGRDVGSYRTAYLDGFRNVREAVRDRSPGAGRIVLVSSTGVYGYTDGRWVDEDTPPEPADATARVLLEAETRARSGEPPGIVLRLGGIYGPGRTRAIRRVLDGSAGCPGPDRYGNRIHRDDAAGALAHLLALDAPRSLYLGVDREPAPLRELYRWIAARGRVDDPCEGADDDEAWEAAGRRGTSKRCRSDRLVDDGYAFRYPTFREGYAPLIDGLAATAAADSARAGRE